MKKPSKDDAPSAEAHANVTAIVAAESAVVDEQMLATWSADAAAKAAEAAFYVAVTAWARVESAASAAELSAAESALAYMEAAK